MRDKSSTRKTFEQEERHDYHHHAHSDNQDYLQSPTEHFLFQSRKAAPAEVSRRACLRIQYVDAIRAYR